MLVVLDYLKENEKLASLSLETLIPELINKIKKETLKNLDHDELNSGKERFKAFINQQKDEIISLLGGEQSKIKNLFNMRGYITIDKDNLKIAGQLTAQLQKDLGLKNFELINAKNSVLKDIVQIVETIVPYGENNRIVRAKDISVAKKLYPNQNLQEKYLDTSDLIKLLDLKINKLIDTNNDVKFAKLEFQIDMLLEEIEANIHSGIGITKSNYKEFKAIYKEHVKNNDFLEDRHENKIKDLKKDFKNYLKIDIKENLIDDKILNDIHSTNGIGLHDDLDRF